MRDPAAPRREPEPAPLDSAELVGLLAEGTRLRVVAALALGAATTEQVCERTGLDARAALSALSRLTAAGLTAAQGEGWLLHEERFAEAARSARPAAEPEDVGTDPATAAVLRAFLRDGRLTAIPAARGKRRVVLEHVVRLFEPGVRYPERDVSALLRAVHADYAALRRYLVDEGLLSREAGVYWRSGGPVEV